MHAFGHGPLKAQAVFTRDAGVAAALGEDQRDTPGILGVAQIALRFALELSPSGERVLHDVLPEDETSLGSRLFNVNHLW